MHKIAALAVGLCAAIILCGGAMPQSEDQIIREMVLLYGFHQEEAMPQIEPLLDRLLVRAPSKGNQWQRIMDYWRYTNGQLPVNLYFPPEDLNGDNNLCILVLGYKLAPSGAIYPELEGRLYTALSCALLYPDAPIICTGGGTAKLYPGLTEAAQMKKWLIKNGIDENRILIEDSSFTTGQNAINTLALIEENLPDVDSLLIVSSDYHVPWASAVFQTACLMRADEKGRLPIRVVGNAADHPESHENYPFSYQAAGILEIAGMTDTAMNVYNGVQPAPRLR